MTSFGPVPFDVIKAHINSEIADAIERNKEEIISAVEKTEETAHKKIDYYIESLAKKKGWKPERMSNFLNTLDDINPGAAFQVVLKEIAIDFDKKYEDSINKCEEIFGVSLLDGRIHKISKAHIKSFRNFAAFRTLEDAKLACKILKDPLKRLFKSDSKK